MTIHDNVLYFVKGSGGNGVNTVYFVDTTGRTCPTGVGVPESGAALPQQSINYDPATVQTQGVTPYNMCSLAGFPTATKSKTFFPAGIWFANDRTLYLTQQGNGDTTYSSAANTYTTDAAQTVAGLQSGSAPATPGAWPTRSAPDSTSAPPTPSPGTPPAPTRPPEGRGHRPPTAYAT